MAAADDGTAVTFSLSPGRAGDAPGGRKPPESPGPRRGNRTVVMDRAREGAETRQLGSELGFVPVVPPLSTRVDPWRCDRELYGTRNEIERLFHRPKALRRILSRFDKFSALFTGSMLVALIFDALRQCEQTLVEWRAPGLEATCSLHTRG